jgi:hypothetical protein
VTDHQSLLQTGTTRSREGVSGSGSPVMRPKTLPRLRVTYGEDSKECNRPRPEAVVGYGPLRAEMVQSLSGWLLPLCQAPQLMES